MIKITIERISTTLVPVKKQYLTSSEPALDGSGAPIYQSSEYGNDRKLQKKETYEVSEVMEERTTRLTLLQQEIPTDDPTFEGSFDLAKVISAINSLDEVSR